MDTTVLRQTIFSPDRVYRYTLWREWALEDLLGDCSALTRAHQYLMVIGLNPSTADETKNDPTIRKCIGFAKRWGYGALCMTNLFAWRDTDPAKMKAQPEPVGPENDSWLANCAFNAGRVLAAWGKHDAHRGRAEAVQEMLWFTSVYCLRKNKDGSPEHPLYVPYETEPTLL